MALPHSTVELRALDIPRLDSITRLNVNLSDGQAEAVVDSVREIVLRANRHDRWDNPEQRGAVIHELADELVPFTADLRVKEFLTIRAAWRADLTCFPAYSAAHEQSQWTKEDLVMLDNHTAHIIVGRALYLAYTDAVRNLLTWLENGDD